MAKLSDIIAFCDEYLEIAKFKDSSLNGLQVEGKSEVKKIALGVSCNQRLFKTAQKNSCDLIITHHGLLWNKRWQYIRGPQKDRIKFLLEKEISLAAYHLPLDAHPEIGNNPEGLKRLGVDIKGKFGWYDGSYIGFWGQLTSKITLVKFRERVDKVFNTRSQSVAGGKAMIETVAFVSGGARMYLEEAIDKGLDVYLTGETNESAPAMALEGGINFISAGHYNTEKFGVMSLGKVLEKKFRAKTEFIDVPNAL
ncbi:Nif3-like dinuclear metal center hexameric protein [Candidatus Microgenomates bacterium]|nr:Nif3-like dinuclear metal center hexameric protein [Candidatus Microgenomates bacterium]